MESLRGHETDSSSKTVFRVALKNSTLMFLCSDDFHSVPLLQCSHDFNVLLSANPGPGRIPITANKRKLRFYKRQDLKLNSI